MLGLHDFHLRMRFAQPVAMLLVDGDTLLRLYPHNRKAILQKRAGRFKGADKRGGIHNERCFPHAAFGPLDRSKRGVPVRDEVKIRRLPGESGQVAIARFNFRQAITDRKEKEGNPQLFPHLPGRLPSGRRDNKI